MKGVELQKAKKNTDASATFKDFIDECPSDAHVAEAQKHRRELGMSVPAPRNSKAKQKSK